MKNEANFPKTLQEAIKYFSDLDTCNTFMAQLRWPEGVDLSPLRWQGRILPLDAPHVEVHEQGCHKQFSVKVGTIMEDSPIGLDKWLAAIWLIANCEERH